VTDASEKPPFLKRFRIPALLGTAVVCSLTGYFLSSHLLTEPTRDRESFSASASDSTPENLTQSDEPSSFFPDEVDELSASDMGDYPNAEPDIAQVESPAANLAIGPGNSPPDDFSAHMTVADGHLRSGNTVAAHRIYTMLRDESPGKVPATVQFRLALAAESFGDFSTALSHYESLLNMRSETGWMGVAMLGRARCLDSLGRVDLISRDFLPLVAVDDSLTTPRIRQELMHLLGCSMLPARRHVKANELLRDDSVAIPDYRVDVNDVLDLLATDVTAVTSATMAPQLSIIQALSEDAETIFLQAHIPNSQVSWVLGELGQRCGLRLTMTDAARILATDRTAAVHTEDKSLALLLDGLTLPYGLVWEQSASNILVSTRVELIAERAKLALSAAVERLQRTALLEAPDSRQAPFTRIALGGLLFEQQSYADAAHMFSLALDTEHRIRIRSETAFNLGKCQLQLKQPGLALESFLLGLDASTGSPDVRLACHLYTARIHILMGNENKAVAIMRRALSMAADREIEPTVALLLSSSFLLAGQPQGANDVLMKRRELFGDPSDRSAAAFLSALARFRAALLEDRRNREARAVVTALGAFDADRQFGEHWHVLAAQACSEIGLANPASSHWNAALSALDEVPLKAYVISQLAEAHRSNQQYDTADKLLRLAPSGASDAMARTILLQSARLDLQRGQADAAIAKCKQVLQQATEAETQQQAMKLLGTAYEDIGNHQAAVYCFAGMLQEAVASESSQSATTFPGVAE